MPAATAVFAGPSLPPAARPAYSNVLWLPPVARGDVARLVASRQRPCAIAIIDGLFEGVPAVSHKEILWALAEGIPVLGAASMGALRAAELAPFGMVGIGRIFTWYREGVLVDDDEVAVHHGPQELGWPTVSLAMVDLRATIEAAVQRGLLDASTARVLVAAGKRIFYKERSWKRVFEDAQRSGADPAILQRLARSLPQLEVPQKRLDARALVAFLGDCAIPPIPSTVPADFGWTEIFARLAGSPEHPLAVPVDADPLWRLALDEIRLDPVRFALVADRARLAAAATGASLVDPGAAIAHRLGLPTRCEQIAWLAHQGLEATWLEDLALHAARLATSATAVDDVFLMALVHETISCGLWPAVVARARRKLPHAEVAEAVGPARRQALLSWYFEVLLGGRIPADAEQVARERGFRDLDDLVRALDVEWRYRNGS
ncbi:hypothetical protein HRbin40_00941 [bacterium HR40]|nr:hypothetical protein HRbin40_00941 [bacterium HR40]